MKKYLSILIIPVVLFTIAYFVKFTPEPKDSYATPVGLMMGAAVTGSGAGGASPAEGVIGQIDHTDFYYTFNSDYYAFSPFVTDTPGTVGYAHIWVVNGDGSKVCVGLHNSSTGEQIVYGESATISGDGGQWVNIALNTTYVLVAATTYWVGGEADSSTDFYKSAGGGVGIEYHEMSYTVPPGEMSDDGTANSNEIAIILNNTAGAPE